jgi:hypothetical protein
VADAYCEVAAPSSPHLLARIRATKLLPHADTLRRRGFEMIGSSGRMRPEINRPLVTVSQKGTVWRVNPMQRAGLQRESLRHRGQGSFSSGRTSKPMRMAP